MVHQSKQKDIPQTPTIGGAAEFVLPVPAATSEPMSLITMLNASGPTQPLRAPTPQLAFAQDPIGRQPSPATPTTPTFPMGQFWSPQAAPISQMSLSIPDNNTYDTDKKKKLAPMHVLEMELDSPSEEPRGGRKGRKYCFFFKNRTNVYICGLISLIILIIMIIVGVLYYPR